MNYLLGLILFGFALTGSDGNDRLKRQAQTGKIEGFFKSRCYANSRKGDAFDNLMTRYNEFEQYLKYTATFLPLHIPHFCKNERPNLSLRMKDITKELANCLPYEENFLPSFITTSFNEFLHFLCHDDGEFTKTYFSSQGKECRTALQSNNGSGEITECFGKLFNVVSDRGYIKKQELCDDIGVVRKCFTKTLDRHCYSLKAFKEINEQFFKYINKPCSACLSYTSSLILLTSCLLLTVYNRLF